MDHVGAGKRSRARGLGSKHVRLERVSSKWSTSVPWVSSALARGGNVRLVKNRTVMPRTTLLDFKYQCGSPIHRFGIVVPYTLMSFSGGTAGRNGWSALYSVPG